VKITKGVQIEMTPEVLYLRGQFHLWQYCIPYYLCAVPWDFVRKHFTLIDELPSSAREEWSLQELFQRDIDWKRIKADLVKYLKSETQPQFFNALTIALLPKHGDTFGHDYRPQVSPSLDDPNLDPVHAVGGIQLFPFKDSDGSAGKLRWDAKTTVAVAVDGQHRLAAIKELGTLADAARREASAVPVLFLIPDEAAGLLLPPQPKGTDPIKATLRRIFIDLNKHAKDIPLAREILLDDQDIHRVCLRRLVADRLTSEDVPNKLPLGLVDWVSEDNKIDKGPFVTSVLLLERLTTEILGKKLVLGEIDDGDSLEDIEQERNRIQDWIADKFRPSSKQLANLMGQVSRCLDHQVKVSWAPEHLDYFASRFEELWVPHLYRIFRELVPYRDLWDFSASKGLLAPEMVTLYAAREVKTDDRAKGRAQEIQEEVSRRNPSWSLTEDFSKPLAEIDERIKRGHWAFAVVFQRALFRSYAQLWRQRPDLVGGHAGAEERFTSFWLEAINRLLVSDLCRQDAKVSRPAQLFWAGIGLKADTASVVVDFSNAGCERLARWISAWVLMCSLQNVPTLKELQHSDGVREQMLKNMTGRKPVLKGFLDVAGVQLPGASPERIDERARDLLSHRYEILRDMARP
jgi:DGQHR domain-containing protein